MKFTIMSGDLASAVAWTSHALPKRPAVPVLGGLLVDASDNGVTLSAYDYDTSRQVAVDLDAPIDPGKALLPGRTLVEVAKALPKRELVDVSADDREAVIRCGKAEFGLPLMPVDDYPNLPTPPAAVGSVSTKMFADAVAKAAVAAGTNDAMPMLSGVRFEVGDGLIDLAATDRYRMTWRTLPWSPVLDEPGELKVLIPAKELADIARGLPADTSVEVCLSEQLAAFIADGRTTTVRLLDSDFADFRSHIGAERNLVAEFDAAVLAKVVKRVALMAERNAAVRLSFSKETVLVEAGGGDAGRGSEQADASLDGDIQIAFNPAFLLDGLNAFGAGTVQLRMETPTKPAVLQREGDDSYRHLIMPVRLS